MKYLATFLLVIGALFMSCDENSKANNKMEDISQEMSEDFENAKNETAEALRTARANIQDKINEIDAQMEEAGENASAEMKEQRANLEDAMAKLDARMEKLGENIEDGWQSFVAETNEFLSELREEFNFNG